MQVNDIIALARTLTQTTTTQVGATQWLQFLNIVYRGLANRIVAEVDEGFFWDTFTTDTVVDQNEYPLPIPTSTATWIKKVTRVEVKYLSADSYKTLINADTIQNYDKSDVYTQENQSTQTPFFDLRDGSIFIYPKPTEAITGGLKVSGITTVIDLLAWWAETSVFPRNQDLRDFHHILAIWMKQYIYAFKWKENAKNDAINEFELEANKMIAYLQNRINPAIVAELPTNNLTN